MLIEVQHCIDCHLHNWCSRHNEAKYHEFYQKLQAKIKSIDRHAKIHKNQIPPHYQERNFPTGSPQAAHRYYDEQKYEDVVFPRHGAFEVKVNGVLIFSKLQSNLWPNLQKIASIIAQIRSEVDAGRDIHKFSLDYRLENNNKEDEKFVDTYKRVIKFKINKRPHSSQFNASAYLPKGSLEPTPEAKYSHLKRKNVTSLKKAGYDLHRKSDVARKPLIRFRHSKVEQNNLYNQFQEPKDGEERSQPSEVGKIVKNQLASPHSKKKIQFKNEVLHPIKAQPFQIIANNNSSLKLEKKPSRKLIIKTNDKKSDLFSQPSSKFGENNEQQIDASDKVIINHSPVFFTNISTKKSLKSVISIGDKLQNREDKHNRRVFNQIKVEDYFTEKQIDNKKVNTQNQIQKGKSNEEVAPNMQSSSVGPIQSIHIEEQQPQVKKEPTQKLVSQYDVNSFEEPPEALESRSKKTVQSQQIQEKQERDQQKEEKQEEKKIIQEKQEITELEQQVRLPSEKRNTEKSNSKYEEQLYDNFEIQQEEEEEIRPSTSSSRRMLNEQIKREEEILEYQEVVEGNFKKKGNTTVQKVKEEDYYEEEFPAEQAQEIPIVVNQRQPEAEEEKKLQVVLDEQVKPAEEKHQQEKVENVVEPQPQPEAHVELKRQEAYQTFERKQLIYEFDEEEEPEHNAVQNKQEQQLVSKQETVQAQPQIEQVKQEQICKKEKEHMQSQHQIAKQAAVPSQKAIEEAKEEAKAEEQVKDQIQVEKAPSNHQLSQPPLEQPSPAQQQPKQAQIQVQQNNLQPSAEPAKESEQQLAKEQENIQQDHVQNVSQPEPENVEERQYQQARQQEKHEQLQKPEQVPIEDAVQQQKAPSQPAILADQNAIQQQQGQKLPLQQDIESAPIEQAPLVEEEKQQAGPQSLQKIEEKPQEIEQEEKQQVHLAQKQQDKAEQLQPLQNVQPKQEANLHGQPQNLQQQLPLQEQQQPVLQTRQQEPQQSPIVQPQAQTKKEPQRQQQPQALPQALPQVKPEAEVEQKQQQEQLKIQQQLQAQPYPQPQNQKQQQQQSQALQQAIPQQIQQQPTQQQENNVSLQQPAAELSQQPESPPKEELPSDPQPKVPQQQRYSIARQQSVVADAQSNRQNNMPSIHHIASLQSVRGPETLRSIPNVTQSSIALTSQIHSELNNVYEQIEARIDARTSVAQQ